MLIEAIRHRLAGVQIDCRRSRLGGVWLDVDRRVLLPDGEAPADSCIHALARRAPGCRGQGPERVRSQGAPRSRRPPLRDAPDVTLRWQTALAKGIAFGRAPAPARSRRSSSTSGLPTQGAALSGGSALAPPAWPTIRERPHLNRPVLPPEGGAVSSWCTRHVARFTRPALRREPHRRTHHAERRPPLRGCDRLHAEWRSTGTASSDAIPNATKNTSEASSVNFTRPGIVACGRAGRVRFHPRSRSRVSSDRTHLPMSGISWLAARLGLQIALHAGVRRSMRARAAAVTKVRS